MSGTRKTRKGYVKQLQLSMIFLRDVQEEPHRRKLNASDA